MRRLLASSLVVLLLMLAGATVALGEGSSQYRRSGPARYVVSIWDVIHDQGKVRAIPRTSRVRDDRSQPHQVSGVLPGEWHGPIKVLRSVDHLSWAGAYVRQDGAFGSNVYEVEVKEGQPLGLIRNAAYPVEISFRLVKRPPLLQPRLGAAE